MQDYQDASGMMETVEKTWWVVRMCLDREPQHRGLDIWERLCYVRTQATAPALLRHKAHISSVLLFSCYRSSHANPHFLGGYVMAAGRKT